MERMCQRIVPSTMLGTVSSVGSDEDFEDSIPVEQELPSAVHDSEETFEVPDRIAVFASCIQISGRGRCSLPVSAKNRRDEERPQISERLERGWKLLLLLPRMLLHRPPGGGKIAKSKLIARFEAFNRGEWINLVAASELCDDKAASARGRASRRDQDNLESRSRRAEMLVSLGELSSARQAPEDAELVPRNQRLMRCGMPGGLHVPEHHCRTGS